MREKKHRSYLLCLLLPGNIEKKFYPLQTALFRISGLLSARALPPLIPICWLQTEKTGVEELRDLPDFLKQKTGSDRILQINGAVYADLPEHAELGRVQVRLKRKFSAVPALFPMHAGVFLAGFSGETGSPAGSIRLPESVSLPVAVRTAALLALEYERSLSRYWENISWEIVEEKQLKER